MNYDHLRQQAEFGLGAARLDLARGKGSKKLVALLRGLHEELSEQKPIPDIIKEILASLEKLGWRP